MMVPRRNASRHKPTKEAQFEGLTTPLPPLSVVETFVKGKEQILQTALAHEMIFRRHHLLEDLKFFCEATRRDGDTLSHRVMSLAPEGFPFRHDAFSRAVESILNSGRTIADLFVTEQSHRRANQLLTWLDTSSDTVVLSARFSLTPRDASLSDQ